MDNDLLKTCSSSDVDALHILPLGALDMNTKALREARLIKNNNLQSVVELFHGEDVGSGQMEVENLCAEFGWDLGKPPHDLLLLRRLTRLTSFDVYSLRITLRELGVDISDVSLLQLSEEKRAELTKYMKVFTEPLITQIYGGEDISIDSFDDVVGLFADPDIVKVRARLEAMAEKLQIDLMDVPRFLEDFGDVFLSLSYYRSCLDRIEPLVDEFSYSVDDLKQSYQFRNNAMLMETCRVVEVTVTNLLTAIGGRLETFEKNTEHMWEDLNADKFNEVKRQIESYHKIIGGSLCALTVKMDAWAHNFPSRDVGGPTKRSEFIMSEMKGGIDKLRQIQAMA